MIGSIKDYIKRHRRGILTTATIVGGGYIAGKYASQKIQDLQEKANAERVAKENLKRRFQQNQNDCVFTVLSLLPTLGDQILEEMNIERDWNKLQESRKLEKIELKLRKEREEAALLNQEKQIEEASEQLPTQQEQDGSASETGEATKEDAKVAATTTSSSTSTSATSTVPPGLDSSVSSLSTSFNAEEGRALPSGILDRHQKHAIWENIKAKSFVRSFTAIYSITLLTLLTHIQLNLMGRFTYIWSVSILNKCEPTIRLQQEGKEDMDAGYLDPKTERLFLSLSWWLLHRGWKRCAERVEKAVEEVIANIPLKNTLDYYEAEELLIKLRKAVELDGSQPFNYRTWMMPDTPEEEAEFKVGAGFSEDDEVDSSNHKDGKEPTITFRKLVDETKDYIDSPDFSQVATACFNEVFAIFDHHAFALTLTPDLTEPIESSIRELTPSEALNIERKSEKRMTLANLLPTIGRQAHLAIAGNEYLNAFAYIKELQAFSALIYTQYNTETL